jgi:hypothetical protein
LSSKRAYYDKRYIRKYKIQTDEDDFANTKRKVSELNGYVSETSTNSINGVLRPVKYINQCVQLYQRTNQNLVNPQYFIYNNINITSSSINDNSKNFESNEINYKDTELFIPITLKINDKKILQDYYINNQLSIYNLPNILYYFEKNKNKEAIKQMYGEDYKLNYFIENHFYITDKVTCECERKELKIDYIKYNNKEADDKLYVFEIMPL